MKTIENFNSSLNQTANDDLKSLKGFRKVVDDLLLKEINSIRNKEVALVIGSGNLNDFSLNSLSDKFTETVLTDVDLSSTKNALDLVKKDGNLNVKVTLIRIEYTGFEKNLFFSRFKEEIIKLKEFKDVESFLKKKLNGLENYRFLKDYQKQVDLLYVSPIYTQLIYYQVMQECAVLRNSGYPEHNIKFIEDYMLEEMPYVIDRFNSNLVNALHDEGRMIVVSDIFQADKGSKFYNDVSQSINDFKMMENIYSKYVAEYGIGLGDFGLINLNDKLRIQSSRWAIWPFDDKSSFIVKIQTYIK